MAGYHIVEIWAFLAVGGDDDVIGYQLPNGNWISLVAADKRRIEDLRPLAERIARESGARVCLARVRWNMETLGNGSES